jgi:surface protein
MFQGATNFNGNVSAWDVSNATNMTGIFLTQASFNQNISAWNVSGVTNMRQMFGRRHHSIKILMLGMFRMSQIWRLCSVKRVVLIRI